MPEWNTMTEFFECLNKSIKYVVLRSYEKILSEDFIDSGKDLDILCENRKQFEKICGYKDKYMRLITDNSIRLRIKKHNIPVDVYEPGDGYYDERWEIDIIKNRMLKDGIVYIPDVENQKYSYMYHVLYHKKKIKEEDYIVLNNYGVSGKRNDSSYELEKYMLERGYKYSYPVMRQYINFSGISNRRIGSPYKSYIYRLLAKIQFEWRKIGKE